LKDGWKSLRKQLDHIIVHEQEENGVSINRNLSVDKIDYQFITPTRVLNQNKNIRG
jgi:hypothetical protein